MGEVNRSQGGSLSCATGLGSRTDRPEVEVGNGICVAALVNGESIACVSVGKLLIQRRKRRA
jgi:hypothetical protein